MKSSSLCILAASALLLNSCEKKLPTPNVSDFHVTQLSPSIRGIRGATVQISSSSLASGEYIFSYSNQFINAVSYLETAKVTMMNGTGTFTTPVYDAGDGRLFEELTFGRVANKDRGTSNIYMNNKLFVTDSGGSVHITISKTSPATTDSFYTYTALAFRSVASGYINMQFIQHNPHTSASKQLYFSVYNNVTPGKSYNFVQLDSLVTAEYYELGEDYYGVPTSRTHHGNITFSKVTPTLEGTFYFVTEDSTRYSGTFSALTRNQ